MAIIDLKADLGAYLENAPYFIREKDEIGWTDNLKRLATDIVPRIKYHYSEDLDFFIEILFNEKFDFTLPSQILRRLFGSKNPASEGKPSDISYPNSEEVFARHNLRCETLLRSRKLFSEAKPSRIIIDWWAMNKNGLNHSDFEPFWGREDLAPIFFDLNVIRSSSGDYIDFNNPILSINRSEELANKILNNSSASPELAREAKTYLKRLHAGKFERDNKL